MPKCGHLRLRNQAGRHDGTANTKDAARLMSFALLSQRPAVTSPLPLRTARPFSSPGGIRTGHGVPGGHHNPPRDGQPQHPTQEITDRSAQRRNRWRSRNRFTVHYTPTHGSWLNQAEIEIGLFSRQCLGTRRIPDLNTLDTEVRAWNRDVNHRRTRINWRFDRKAARRQFGYKRKSIKRSRY